MPMSTTHLQRVSLQQETRLSWLSTGYILVAVPDADIIMLFIIASQIPLCNFYFLYKDFADLRFFFYHLCSGKSKVCVGVWAFSDGGKWVVLDL